MKALKYLLIFLIVLLSLTFALLRSGTALDFIAKRALQFSGLDIGYERLSGDLFSGLAVLGAHYGDRAGADLYLRADFTALAGGVLHIEEVRVEELWIKEDFLKALSESNATERSDRGEAGAIPLREIRVDRLLFTTGQMQYGPYRLSALQLEGEKIRYDMGRRLDGVFHLTAQSSVADLNATATVRESRYRATLLVDIKRPFLTHYLQAQQIVPDRDPRLRIGLDGDLHRARYNVTLMPLSVQKQPLRARLQKAHITGSYGIDQNRLDAQGDLQLLSDAADLNLTFGAQMQTEDIAQSLRYDANMTAITAKPALAALLKDRNISFTDTSLVKLYAKGDLKEVDASLHIAGGEVVYGAYHVVPGEIDTTARYRISEGALSAEGRGELSSNVADLNWSFRTAFVTEDPIPTLRLRLDADLTPEPAFVRQRFAEENLTRMRLPALHLTARNGGEVLHGRLWSDEAQIVTEKIEAALKKLHADFRLNTRTQHVAIDYSSVVTSTLADLNIEGNSSVRLNDINATLRYAAKSIVQAREGYLRKRFAHKRVDLKELSPLFLNLSGDAKRLDAAVKMSGVAYIAGERIAPRIEDTKLYYDLRNRRLEASVNTYLRSGIADAKLKGKAILDLHDINGTLHYTAMLRLRQKKRFEGIDLSQLGGIYLDLNGTARNLHAKLKSKKVAASVRSGDMDRFDFRLNTDLLHLDRIYSALPPQMKRSSAALDAQGYYRLHEREGDIALRLKALQMMERKIATNRFHLRLKGEDFQLSPLEIKAKGFALKLEAKREAGHLFAKVENSAFNGFVDFTQEPLQARGKIDIPSIGKMIAQIDRIYPMDGVPAVKGSLYAKVDTADGGRIRLQVRSPEIALEAGRFENLDIVAFYRPQRIDIARFGFEMKGFKPKAMNRTVSLAHPGFVTFGKDGINVDFVLRNLLSFKVEQKGDLLIGKFRTKRLFLAYSGFGQTRISADIDLYRSGTQSAVSGDVVLEETEITYESRVLDVSQDPDIIIVHDKKRKRQTDDDFTKNLFLDLHIYSKDEVVYKVEAGTIMLKPDIEIRKDFGSGPRLLGKVKILEGEYDWGDKRFRLKEGAIAFRGLEEINPHLDLHVEYEIEDVLIYIDILGDKRKPKLIFKSKPMMSKKDIFSYLLFGFAVSESDGAQSSAASAAEKIFGRALAKDLARELHLDRLDLMRNELGGIDIKAGKKVNKKTIIYYQNKVENRLQQSSVIVERKLGKHLELDLRVGQESQAVDLIYKKGFK